MYMHIQHIKWNLVEDDARTDADFFNKLFLNITLAGDRMETQSNWLW